MVRVFRLRWGWTPFSQMDRVAALGPNERNLGESRVLVSGRPSGFGGGRGGVRLTNRRLLLDEDRGPFRDLLTDIPRLAVIGMSAELQHPLSRWRPSLTLTFRTSIGKERWRVQFLNRWAPHMSLSAQARAFFPLESAAPRRSGWQSSTAWRMAPDE